MTKSNRIVAATLAVLATAAITGCASSNAGSADYAILSTSAADIPGKIYPAFLAKVDDREITGGSGLNGRKSAVRVSPGTHTVRLTADLSQATGAVPSVYTPRDKQAGNMQIDVEAGKRYFLGAKLTADRLDEWEPVVWRVEDIR